MSSHGFDPRDKHLELRIVALDDNSGYALEINRLDGDGNIELVARHRIEDGEHIKLISIAFDIQPATFHPQQHGLLEVIPA